ncbi:MAG: hypothetical protein BGO54_13240 [Sphingobacteriales bacterium 46-32]|nr:MAG: hypothetical protein BGO54_13240 [Sphingobacteriales bacterium 46-32]
MPRSRLQTCYFYFGTQISPKKSENQGGFWLKKQIFGPLWPGVVYGNVFMPAGYALIYSILLPKGPV